MEGFTGHGAKIVQLVAHDGTPHTVPGFDPECVADRLPGLYETMLAARGVDEELVNLQRQGQLALYASCRGQEAAQVGCAAAARDDDWLFPQYRELGMYLHRGIDPVNVGLAWRGGWHGGYGFVGHRVAPMSIPVGTHALHAVGAAMAAQWLGEDTVTMAFIGDGATSEGDVHEALNLASVRQAPCVFFVQNNQWAISTPVAEQLHGRTIAARAQGYGMPGVRVDGNDVAACLLVAERAVERARAGNGPTLVEALTYRLGPHTTSDDPRRYRSDDDVARWEARDPLARCRRFLEKFGRWDDVREEEAAAYVAELRAHVRAGIVDAPDPSPLELFDFVFETPTAELRAERDRLAEELRRDG